MVFEFLQLARIYVCALIHSFIWPGRANVRVYNAVGLYASAPPTAAGYTLSSDWAWPGFLLPCFLLCIPNYGGEFLGRATRIARRFGLISSLNRDISRLQPSVPLFLLPLPRRVHSQSVLTCRQSGGERFIFLYLLSTLVNFSKL